VRDDYFHDDPVEDSYGKNFVTRILVAASLVLGSIYLFQSTFARNTSINSSESGELSIKIGFAHVSSFKSGKRLSEII
jgi:hypothetical protein